MSDELEKKTSKMTLNPNAFEFTPSWMSNPQPPAPSLPAVIVPTPAPAPIPVKPSVVNPPRSPPRVPSTIEKKEPKVFEQKEHKEVPEDEPVDDSNFVGTKDIVNIVFIGHVDAGKSTMGGHILFLTGMVDKRTMEKYEKEAKEAGRESWYLSWALDLNAEERNKGKTVEYGRGYFETPLRRFTVLDAPGHKTYVPSMISGAAQADVGVLVISARKGEFETGFEKGGQTREHAVLAKTAGVKRLIMVINKMDDPTVCWSKERYDECVSKILPFLKGCGYNPKTDLDILPISGFSGANLKDRLDPAVCDWYQGPSLLELLDTMEISRKYDGALMFPISDKHKDMGTVVQGKIESGKVKKGQNIMIMPNKKIAEVLAIFTEDNEVNAARSGDNIRMRLKNVEEEDVSPGFVICSPAHPIHCVTSFTGQLVIVELAGILCAGFSGVMHAHNAVEEVTISELLYKIDKKTGKKSTKPPRFLKQGDKAVVNIELTQSVCLETYADYNQLGRFTLRDEGRTVAIGTIQKLLNFD